MLNVSIKYISQLKSEGWLSCRKHKLSSPYNTSNIKILEQALFGMNSLLLKLTSRTLLRINFKAHTSQLTGNLREHKYLRSMKVFLVCNLECNMSPYEFIASQNISLKKLLNFVSSFTFTFQNNSTVNCFSRHFNLWNNFLPCLPYFNFTFSDYPCFCSKQIYIYRHQFIGRHNPNKSDII